MALQQGRAADAVDCLRTALSYQPNDRADELMLAQALADSGRIEEAVSYFYNLREARPGDGFINLQLARLARKKGDASEAINDYRAAIFGNWEGDGVERRRTVRLELADYLSQRGDVAGARSEVLIAASDSPETPDADVSYGDRLRSMGDLSDALIFYRKAIAAAPHDDAAIEEAGRVAYELGNYSDAEKLLTQALQGLPNNAEHAARHAAIASLASEARRLQDLDLSHNLSAAERTQHILAASQIAYRRLGSCSRQLTVNVMQPSSSQSPAPVPLASLLERWKAVKKELGGRNLEHDSVMQDNIAQLISETELQTAGLCSAPSRDDMLLLMLAKSQLPSVQ